VPLEDLDDQRGVGESKSLEGLGVLLIRSKSFTRREAAYGSRDISTGDTLRSGIKEIECWRFTDLGNDLGSNTECWESTLDSD